MPFPVATRGQGHQPSTPPGPPPYSLADIPGVQVAFEADLPVLADNAEEITWTDQSGNGRDAVVPGGGTSGAICKAGILNGRSVLRFGGTKPMSVPTNPHGIGTGDFSVITIAKPASLADYRALSSNGSFEPGFYLMANGKVSAYIGGTDKVFDTVLSTSNFYVIEIMRESGTLKCRINGVEEATTYANSTSIADLAYFIGADSVVGGSAFIGDKALDVLANVALTGSAQTDLYDYINDKYAIF